MAKMEFLPLLVVLATLGPLAAFLGWWVAGARMRRRRLEERPDLPDDEPSSINWSWVAGLCVGVVALWAAEMPMVLMHGHVSRVVDFIDGDESAITSVEKLRTPGREAFLRHLCEVGLAPGNFGPLAHMYGLSVVKEEDDEPFRSLGFRGPPPHRELMGEVYLRVTGHPFKPGS